MTAATSKLAQVATTRKKCKTCRRNRSITKFKRCGAFISADGHQPVCVTCMDETRTRKKAERAAAEKAAKPKAASITEESLLRPGFTDDFTSRVMKLAAQARGMAMMDPRLDDHANELELLATDIVKVSLS